MKSFREETLERQFAASIFFWFNFIFKLAIFIAVIKYIVK
jgi:hypothetical protein